MNANEVLFWIIIGVFVLALVCLIVEVVAFQIVKIKGKKLLPEVMEDRLVLFEISLSLNQTKIIAKEILPYIKQGDLIVLQGDLGAGKSVLVREILTQLGVKNKITSPTFTLVNEYKTGDGHYYHFDMYRLEDEIETENIGFEEMIADTKAIKFVEWAENVKNYLPKHYKKISIAKLGKHSRAIAVEQI
jgi:tRNA threonylcarbamoyladenosine biosynthesis protein TsaE